MFGINLRELFMKPDEADTPTETPEEITREVDLRHQLYERIAQGHALAEAEDIARRKWQGR